MAEESGVTEAGLRTKLADELQATHVEIEDMSGTFLPHHPSSRPPSPFPSTSTENHSLIIRWLRPSIFSNHRLPAVREKDLPRPPQAGEYCAQSRDRSDSRLDSEMLHTGAVGEVGRRGKEGECTRERHERGGCYGIQGLRTGISS